MATTKIEALHCPNCGFDYYPTIDYICHYECEPYYDFFDETFVCACGTEFRIYEKDDFGDWTQEIVYHKDPNQTELTPIPARISE